MDLFMLKNVVFVNVRIRDDHADLERLERTVEKFGEKTVGIKVYFDTEESEVSSINALEEICGFAKERNLRVMVHCANSPTPMSDILNTLNAGDILTHSFHGGVNTAADDGFESMKAAQKRGVIIDSGFAGHIHTDFEVFKKALDAGIVPDSISTDITKLSAFMRGGRYGMTACMSLSRYMGMSEEDIFRAVTVNPAKNLGKENEWGRLKVGGIADIAVLEYTDEGFSFTDKAGHHVESDMGYRCVLTLSDGQVVYRH